MWSDRKARLESCIAQKRNDKWDEDYTVFKAIVGMPKRGTVSENW